MRSRDRVAIGFISPGVVDNKFAMMLATLYRERAHIGAIIEVESSGLLSRGRNELVHRFLDETDCQWLLMIDSDMAFNPGCDLTDFDKLCTTVHDVYRPIVAGLYFGAWPGDLIPVAMPLIFRCENGNPTRFLPVIDFPDNAIIPIDSAGTGCLMVHRSVFDRLREDATEHTGRNWCWFQDMPINGEWFSEDHWFCSRAREAGFALHANTGVVMRHRKKFWLDRRHFVRPEAGDFETTEAVQAMEKR